MQVKSRGFFAVIAVCLLTMVLPGSAKEPRADSGAGDRVGVWTELSAQSGELDNGFRYSSRLEAAARFQESPLEDVLLQGEPVAFHVKAEREDWVRPIHSEAWEEPSYKERFPDASLRVEAALHRLFEMPAGASLSFPFFVDLGLDGEELEDAFGPGEAIEQVGLLILNARVREIRVLGGQAAVVAEPARTGYQVVWVDRSGLPGDGVLFQLVTPDGCEVDYLPIFFE